MDAVELVCMAGGIGVILLFFGLLIYYLSNRPKR